MSNESFEEKIKRGYLWDDFKLFHLKDKSNLEFEFHYHDFNKIIIFISGDVTYLIEGKAYKLKPWDILLVNSNEIHKPVINSNCDYERIIIWVNSKFLEKQSRDCDLLNCFKIVSSNKSNLIRLNTHFPAGFEYTLFKLQDACQDKEFGSKVLKNSLFLQFMVLINRLCLNIENRVDSSEVEYDETINSIINYINENINKDLSIDSISSAFYMNKYYLMHKFKLQTGYTLHSYIMQKRLMLAAALAKKGTSVMDICIKCGFKDYSNFLRAFRNTFGVSPKKYYRTFMEIESSNNMNII